MDVIVYYCQWSWSCDLTQVIKDGKVCLKHHKVLNALNKEIGVLQCANRSFFSLWKSNISCKFKATFSLCICSLRTSDIFIVNKKSSVKKNHLIEKWCFIIVMIAFSSKAVLSFCQGCQFIMIVINYLAFIILLLEYFRDESLNKLWTFIPYDRLLVTFPPAFLFAFSASW